MIPRFGESSRRGAGPPIPGAMCARERSWRYWPPRRRNSRRPRHSGHGECRRRVVNRKGVPEMVSTSAGSCSPTRATSVGKVVWRAAAWAGCQVVLGFRGKELPTPETIPKSASLATGPQSWGCADDGGAAGFHVVLAGATALPKRSRPATVAGAGRSGSMTRRGGTLTITASGPGKPVRLALLDRRPGAAKDGAPPERRRFEGLVPI